MRLLFVATIATSLIACGQLDNGSAEHPDLGVIATYTLRADTLGTVDGVAILEGGYSGLDFDEQGRLWAVTDRGPNLEAGIARGVAAKRFPVPNYRPSLRRLQLGDDILVVDSVLYFVTPGAQVATGLPPPTVDDELTVEQALDGAFEALDHDPEGIDSEGIAFGSGGFFVSDEYRPSVWQYTAGERVRTFTPTPLAPGDEPLPEWLLQRRPNLGFEGVAYRDGQLFVALQGPLSPVGGDRHTQLVRIMRLTPETGAIRTFVYALEGSQRKIGDLAFAPDGQLLVLEHGERFNAGWSAEVYAIDVDHVDFLNADGLPPERFRDVATALANSVIIAPKSLYVDLVQAGWPTRYTKPEGLAVDAEGRMYVVNDNDFGLVSPDADGRATATGVETPVVVFGALP